MKRCYLLVTAVGLLLVAAAPNAPGPDHRTAPIRYGVGRQVGVLANKAIDESSGVAASRREEQLYWTHNDSGNPAELFAFGPTGDDRGRFVIHGAASVDWEDMASFTLDDVAYLLIADVGDNERRRKSCQLYVVREPAVKTITRPAEQARVAMKIEFLYPDGPHNCEAAAVDVRDRAIYLITKETLPIAQVLRIPLRVEGNPAATVRAAGPKLRPAIAKVVAQIVTPTVTGMDISPDGLRMIVVTYGDALEFTRKPDQTWSEALKAPPRRIPLPPRRQGESIGYQQDGKALLLTSEKRPAPVMVVPVLDGQAESP